MRRNIYIADDLHQFAAASGNVSGYVQDLISAARTDYIDALATLAAWDRPMVMACLDAVNGLLWTDGISERDQITADLDDADDLAAKWGLAPERWARLLDMSHAEARAVRVVAREFWAGRPLGTPAL